MSEQAFTPFFSPQPLKPIQNSNIRNGGTQSPSVPGYGYGVKKEINSPQTQAMRKASPGVNPSGVMPESSVLSQKRGLEDDALHAGSSSVANVSHFKPPPYGNAMYGAPPMPHPHPGHGGYNMPPGAGVDDGMGGEDGGEDDEYDEMDENYSGPNEGLMYENAVQRGPGAEHTGECLPLLLNHRLNWLCRTLDPTRA